MVFGDDLDRLVEDVAGLAAFVEEGKDRPIERVGNGAPLVSKKTGRPRI
jgi:hypothetical protein